MALLGRQLPPPHPTQSPKGKWPLCSSSGDTGLPVHTAGCSRVYGHLSTLPPR